MLIAVDALDPPNITVTGYSVQVSFRPARDCYTPRSYSLFLCHVDNYTRLCDDQRFVDEVDFMHPKVCDIGHVLCERLLL